MQIAVKLVDRFQASFADQARRAGHSLAVSLESGRFQRGADYGAMLTRDLRAGLESAQKQLFLGLESAALPANRLADFPNVPALSIAAPSARSSASVGALAGIVCGLTLILFGLVSGDNCVGCAMVLLGFGAMIAGLIGGGILGALWGKLSEKGEARRIAFLLGLTVEQAIESANSRRSEWVARLAGPSPVLPDPPSLAPEEETLLRIASSLRRAS